jgi:hypothetical protein|tara:strand:- start:172 stop:357 length:186 start_codon:yes stop_codon:yes gene_type:complete
MKIMEMTALTGPHHKMYVVYNNRGKIVIITRSKITAKLFLNKANKKSAAQSNLSYGSKSNT